MTTLRRAKKRTGRRGAGLLPGGAVLLLSVCAFVLYPPPLDGQRALPDDDPKVRVAQGVYQDLVRVMGDARPPPRFMVRPAAPDGPGSPTRRCPGSLIVAWYYPDQREIWMDEEVYDLAREAGADSLGALAFILGHELAHFYRDHAWAGDFGTAFAGLEVADSILERHESGAFRVEVETEADHAGGFYGYVAGYNTLGLAEPVLSRIYEAYGCPDELPGYPSLAERRDIARRAEAQLRRQVPLWDAAVRLVLVRKYEEAARIFDRLVEDFPSREIFNNAGVARALEALTLFDDGELPYAYPFELDPHTRLAGGHPAMTFTPQGQRALRRTRLLEEARERFEAARRLDPDYSPVAVNLAAVHDLLGESDMAEVLAARALRTAEAAGSRASASSARVVRAIALDRQGRRSEARAELEAAGGEGFAALNLAVLEGRPSLPAASVLGEPRAREERVAGADIRETLHRAEEWPAVILRPRDPRERQVRVAYGEVEGAEALVVEIGDEAVATLSTGPDYRGASAGGVSVGAPAATLRERYGEPSRHQAAAGGTLHIYDYTDPGIAPADFRASGIAFLVDTDGAVRGWTLFAVR